MNETPVIAAPAEQHHSVRAVLRACAISLLLFSLVLLSLLLLSRTFYLPRVAEIEVNGVRRDIGALSVYQADLLSSVQRAESERDASVVPVLDASHEALKAERRDATAFPVLQQDILREASAVVPVDDAIHISAFSFDAEQKTLQITGDVRHVKTRSMTVLAQFVAVLRHLSFVADLEDPAYVRQDDPVLGIHSPFTLTLTLR